MCLRRTNSTRRSSIPSSATGPNCRTSGTVSAALKMSSKPKIASTRTGGLGTRLRVAIRMMAQVDSVPTRARAIKSFFGEEFVEVLVTRNAARDLGIPSPDEISIFVAEGIKRAVDFCPPPTRREDRAELIIAGRANRHPYAVVSDNV